MHTHARENTHTHTHKTTPIRTRRKGAKPAPNRLQKGAEHAINNFITRPAPVPNNLKRTKPPRKGPMPSKSRPARAPDYAPAHSPARPPARPPMRQPVRPPVRRPVRPPARPSGRPPAPLPMRPWACARASSCARPLGNSTHRPKEVCEHLDVSWPRQSVEEWRITRGRVGCNGCTPSDHAPLQAWAAARSFFEARRSHRNLRCILALPAQGSPSEYS